MPFGYSPEKPPAISLLRSIEIPPFDEVVQIPDRIETMPDPEHTNLASAMKLAQASFPEDAAKRIVIVSDGNENMGNALDQARAAAQGQDVRLGGGVATIRQYLEAGLVDEMHLAIAPVVLGRGEALLADIDLSSLGYRCIEHAGTPGAMHVVLARTS